MAFDVAAARSEGYSDQEIAEHLAKSKGYDLPNALKEGYTPAQVIEHLAGTKAPDQGDVQKGFNINPAVGAAYGTGVGTAAALASAAAGLAARRLGIPQIAANAPPVDGIPVPRPNVLQRPFEVAERFIAQGQANNPYRPQGPSDVVNWASGKGEGTGQYGRGYMGGASQEIEANLQRQADALEARNPGYRVVPGDPNLQLRPAAEVDQMIAKRAADMNTYNQQVEARANAAAEVRRQKLGELQAKRKSIPYVAPQIPGKIASSLPLAGGALGYNLGNLTNSWDSEEGVSPQDVVSGAGALGSLTMPFMNKLPPKAKWLAPAIGLGAPLINQGLDYIQERADGGSIKKALGVLPKAVRQANLRSMTSKSAEPQQMYHGTRASVTGDQGLTQFRPNPETGLTFVTPDPKFAERYMYTPGKGTEGGAIYPVNVQVANPFDYQNAQHVTALADALKKPSLRSEFASGDWRRLEYPETIKAIKGLGHDAMYVEEYGTKNLGLFDPNKIKSSIGNRGTYDTSVPDINMATGGIVPGYAGGKEVVSGLNNLTKLLSKYKSSSYENLPKISDIPGISMGPGGLLKPSPIAPGQELYRQASPKSVEDFLHPRANKFDYNPFFVADTPDLALGQGSNTGANIIFRPNSLSGKENIKPVPGHLTGREYKTDIVAPQSISHFSLDNPSDFRNLDPFTRRSINQNFERLDDPDFMSFVRKFTGNVPGYADGKLVNKMSDFVRGYLHNTKVNPNPLVGTRYDVKDLGGLTPVNPIQLESLRGKMLQTNPWDVMSRNYQINSVSGTPLTSPIITHGGQGYTRDIQHILDQIGGASNEGIAKRVQNRANIASREGERMGGTGEVVNAPSIMAPQSVNFAMPTTQLYMDLLKQSELSPQRLKELSNFLKANPKHSNMFDLSDPRVMKSFEESPTYRKAFLEMMQKKEGQKLLNVNTEDVLASMRDPNLAGVPAGFMGHTGINMQPGASIRPSKNITYSHDVPGTYAGSLPHTPVSVMLNKPFQPIADQLRKQYPDASESQIIGWASDALGKRNKNVSELVNDEMINRVGQYHEGLKQGKFAMEDVPGALNYLSKPGAYAEGGGVPGYADGKSVAKLPEKVVKAYKLFRTDPKQPDNLYPLFVHANEPVTVGQWLEAKAGEMVGDKVKSKLGPLAYRPGWHAGDLPVATHIGSKSSSTLKAPDTRPSNQVWAEVEMPADVDWQSVALERATRNKRGEVIPRTAHITDQVPLGGHYRYKTNPNMTGEWLIGGNMKVNRVLTDDEVRAINEAAGVADLPRREGFAQGGGLYANGKR